MQVIILAGGFGRRLKNHIPSIPKPMAPINNKPFLDYILNYLNNYDVDKIIFSLFHKHQVIEKYYQYDYEGIEISYSIDKGPLGTGGAIKEALSFADNEHIFVINGDTFFNVNLLDLYKKHIEDCNDITFSLKPMKNFDRYGIIKTSESGNVISLSEKEYSRSGQIDGGIYLIKKILFDDYNGEKVFSFNDYIINNLKYIKVGSMVFDEIFIDIGIPEDYNSAQKLLRDQI